jgi:hypothetical protein
MLFSRCSGRMLLIQVLLCFWISMLLFESGYLEADCTPYVTGHLGIVEQLIIVETVVRFSELA